MLLLNAQPRENFNEWRLIYFISFLLLVGFFVLNMFVGVVVENFHRCRAEQEKEERALRAAKRAKKIEERRRSELFQKHASLILLFLLLFSFFSLFRNVRSSLLHQLLPDSAVSAWFCDLQVLRSRHLCRHWLERHHDGHGVLHDAKCKYSIAVDVYYVYPTTQIEDNDEPMSGLSFRF